MLILVALMEPIGPMVAAGDFQPLDYFGFFSPQSNIIAIVVLLISVPFTGKARPAWVDAARAASTAYLVIVSVVYWTILGGSDFSWTNVVMHLWALVIMLIDWLVEGPREPLSWQWLLPVLIYPLVWIAVVLYRGANDGWVPYHFVAPSSGYVSIAMYCAGIAVGTVAASLGLFQLTRWRPLTPVLVYA